MTHFKRLIECLYRVGQRQFDRSFGAEAARAQARAFRERERKYTARMTERLADVLAEMAREDTKGTMWRDLERYALQITPKARLSHMGNLALASQSMKIVAVVADEILDPELHTKLVTASDEPPEACDTLAKDRQVVRPSPETLPHFTLSLSVAHPFR